MSKPKHGSKVIALIVIAIIGAAAGFGYFKQTANLGDSEAQEAKPAISKADAQAMGSILDPRPADIIVGDVNAVNTIVEYMSLSCTHCAHFHQSTLPDVEKEFITTGKAKLIIRHFPLNEPAIKASQLVECAGQNGKDRKNFLKVLLEMQPKWAFGEDYLTNLKQIASVGGIDSAAFESCMTDKSLETRILAGRKEAEDSLKIDSTPTFFINGVKYEGDRDAAGFRKALTAAEKPQK